MGWLKFNDTLVEHPKIARVGGRAGWVYVCGLSYASRNMTDGFVPASTVARMTDFDDAAELAELLVGAGLWERADGGFQIHDYTQHQRTRAQIEADLDADRQRKHAARDRRPGNVRAESGRTVPEVSGRTVATAGESVRSTDKSRTDKKRTDSSSSRANTLDTLPPAAAAAIDVLVKIREHESAGTIRNPSRWRQTVRDELRLEYGPTFAQLVHDAADANVDPVALIEKATSYTRYDALNAEAVQ